MRRIDQLGRKLAAWFGLIALTATGQVVDLSKVDRPPELISAKPIVYPPGMEDNGLIGSVTIESVIGTRGEVITTWVSHASDKRFEAAAKAADATRKYRPAMKDAKPVSTYLTYTVLFLGDEIQLCLGESPLPSGLSKIYELDALERKPGQGTKSKPTYPADLRRAKIPGEVEVNFVLDKTGVVVAAWVRRSTRPEFEPAALANVRIARFRPGRLDGEPVAVFMRTIVKFEL